MSADLLREAAALMRQRAEAATGATYHWKALDRPAGGGGVWCGRVRIGVTDETLTGGPSNAAHIASWHPAVALAVADWLDTAAEADRPYPGSVAVARAYLGRDS